MESKNRVMNIPLDIDQIKTIMDLIIDEIRELSNELQYLFEEDRAYINKEIDRLQNLWEHLRNEYNPSV